MTDPSKTDPVNKPSKNKIDSTTGSGEAPDSDPMCVCDHPLSRHAKKGSVLACTAKDCACGPGCIHEGFVDKAGGGRPVGYHTDIQSGPPNPYMSCGAIEFDDGKISMLARLYIAEWEKRKGVVDRIPLGPPGERFLAWTDITILEVYDWRVFHEVAGIRMYRLPLAAICMPLDIEVIADMHHKLQHGDPGMLATFNAAVDEGKGVHPSVEDGVVKWRTGP